jgi:GntR family transcriptional regulator
VAAEYRLNPLTVLKPYQELVEEGLVEKRRGRGMFVRDGARKNLLTDEREQFINEQWPSVVATIRRLGLDLDTLMDDAKALLDQLGEEEDQ